MLGTVREGYVHSPEKVAIAPGEEVVGRHDTRTDLVGHHQGPARPFGAQSRHSSGGGDGCIVVVARREQVSHPQREAVHHHGRAIGDIAEGFFDFDRFFHRGP